MISKNFLMFKKKSKDGRETISNIKSS
ncbi:hypothetical protein CAEBREN_14390 [Caenorhabditis brenneri]|uniref:Uncharacterized protein n=1 Tax=Caenorhabditis brenneri TaxID=135651 RepID=G0PH61_CAEBE|nr:hypothetical protein CAEBREN_14390 [Caenorhabditis brenneri]